MTDNLYDALLAVRHCKRPNVGICSNVDWHLRTVGGQNAAHRELRRLFAAWPEFSGDLEYPVPHPDPERSPSAAYDGTLRPWDGAYGLSRRRLLDFCILTLESEAANAA